MALFARDHGLGLLNNVEISPFFAIAVSVIALDLIAYWEHRLLHFFGPLWRLHALHHSDTDLDVSSYIRHHPFEVLLQVVLDALVTITLGFSALSIVVYAAIANLVQMAAHANIEVPAPLHWLGMFLVAPEFHRLHHSRRFEENNANFSEAFPFWDYLFGTARRQPVGGLKFGLPEFIETKFQRLDRMLMLPLLVRPAVADTSSAESPQGN